MCIHPLLDHQQGVNHIKSKESLVLLLFKVLNDVANGVKVVQVLIVDHDSEFFLAKVYQISKLQRVDSEIGRKSSFHCDLVTFLLRKSMLLFGKFFRLMNYLSAAAVASVYIRAISASKNLRARRIPSVLRWQTSPACIEYSRRKLLSVILMPEASSSVASI